MNSTKGVKPGVTKRVTFLDTRHESHTIWKPVSHVPHSVHKPFNVHVHVENPIQERTVTDCVVVK